MPEQILLVVRPCPKCNTASRNPTGGCKNCNRLRVIAGYKANPEKHKAEQKARYDADPEKHRAQSRQYLEANRARVNAVKLIWHATNAEALRIKSAEYYAANKDKANAATRRWREANAEHVKATSAAYRAANPDAMRIKKQNRRALKKAVGGKLSAGLSDKLFKLQKGKCPCCGHPLGDDYHRDHKMPLALGGSNTDDNMQLLRAKCNLQKKAKHPVDFMQSRGFLL
jgi:hypothetical protein